MGCFGLQLRSVFLSDKGHAFCRKRGRGFSAGEEDAAAEIVNTALMFIRKV